MKPGNNPWVNVVVVLGAGLTWWLAGWDALAAYVAGFLACSFGAIANVILAVRKNRD